MIQNFRPKKKIIFLTFATQKNNLKWLIYLQNLVILLLKTYLAL